LSFDASLFVDIPTSENPDRLLKLVTALRALKSDQKRVRPGHFALPMKDGVALGPAERTRHALFVRE
jgi:hypothetical protein